MVFMSSYHDTDAGYAYMFNDGITVDERVEK